MACRNLDKSRKVQQEIISLTGSRQVDLLRLDVSSFKAIENFCAEFSEKYHKLDILIHNAGYFNHGEKNYQLSQDNIELTFATNALGPFLMTHLLRDLLKKADRARILNACSTNIRHFFEPQRKIDFDNLQGEFMDTKPYNSYKMYGDSKMALLLLTFKMAEEFKAEGIRVNAVQIPAIKLSPESIRKFKPAWRLAARIQNVFSSAPETMAETYYYICTAAEFNDVTGKLINDKREIMQPSPYTRGLRQELKQLGDKSIYPKYAANPDNIDRMWNLAVKLTNIN
jgi:NAD(P)-dependent dehydrogenase (short-subunit alcohol dehydrogenase family)